MRERENSEQEQDVMGSTFTDGIDFFDLTSQVLHEQEAILLEIDHSFLMQPELEGVTSADSKWISFLRGVH
jgi:hypothetical protein